LALSALTLSSPASASLHSKKTQRQSNTIRCTKVSLGHSKITHGELAACRDSTLKIGKPCPAGSSIITVGTHNATFGLLVGHRPVSLGKQPGMGTFSELCGSSKVPATTTTAAPTPTATATAPPAPATTTTRPAPPPPSTTTFPAPPPTTAECYVDPEGNCYRAGEYCPDSLHGQTVQGESGPITCEDNDGWRWEDA
jgi:hypothetical protein